MLNKATLSSAVCNISSSFIFTLYALTLFVWLQEGYPACSKCQLPMVFLLKLWFGILLKQFLMPWWKHVAASFHKSPFFSSMWGFSGRPFYLIPSYFTVIRRLMLGWLLGSYCEDKPRFDVDKMLLILTPRDNSSFLGVIPSSWNWA